jgi:hypothetical protein
MSAEKFHFQHKGKDFSIPKFENIPSGVVRKARKADNDLDAAYLVLELTLGEDSKELAALDEKPLSEIGEIIKAWTNGVTLGESSGS